MYKIGSAGIVGEEMLFPRDKCGENHGLHHSQHG